ncbi:D-alanyl-D-alanine carboxypeptidase family protein [Anaeromicrobium sediminis]|uniref:serine-type D-Ala-D-Ala carboxypeptidase n=1 Tax=Anaeromicrobium sediminis TaxID=1478221 RepID=A0A267MQZ5_9FIRM|nr:D-alanyl-D-alanine carboxypeptidase family protein [Anaeromicrobium sediminis]PAB61193.1 D-alanyl-D-alanine carboxypeptidase [Anaeromicrobium sediminis]
MRHRNLISKFLRLKKYALLTVCFLVLMGTNSFGLEVPLSASSAILMDRSTGRVLYARNINTKMPMASTTKIMTALLAIKNGDLNSYVKVPTEAVGVEGSSIYLQHGEKILLRDLVYGLMLRSGNDSAVAIAHHVGKSVDQFVDMMNSEAKRLGAKNTNFMNPNGLHHDKHYTTAYDLALITREALKNHAFREVTKTKLWVAEREGHKYFYNKNKTLSRYKGGDGVKTGYTKAAGRCLVTSATRDNMQLIAVVLNDPNWFNDCFRMLDFGFDNFNGTEVFAKDKIAKKVTISNGEKKYTNLVYKDNIVVPLKEGEEKLIKTIIEIDENIQAPIKRRQCLGQANVYLNDKLLGTTDIISREDIEVEKIQNKITNYFKEKIMSMNL